MSGTNFFDFREQMSARNKSAAPRGGPPAPMSVSQLTAIIDRAIRSGVPANVLVKGEVSNLNFHRASGHLYFTLKDASTCIECAMFRSDAERLKFQPADGMELLAGGRVQVYAQRGKYQLYVTTLNPIGQGALELAFQQLRAKLEAQGLFAPQRKKPLPRFPRSIAIVTSQQTAALQDVLKVLTRFTFLRLMLYHVSVQGDGSAEQIADALRVLNRKRSKIGIDLILVARGGGSLEDLWEFNEEIVARAIVASEIPVVTGVGHEVDVTIADLVADYHAHTPTEAAQVIVAHWRTARESIRTIGLRTDRAVRQLVQQARQRLVAIERHEVFRRPLDRINQLSQMLDDRQRSLMLAATHRVQREAGRIERAGTRLAAIHPRHRVGLQNQRIDQITLRLRAGITRTHERQLARLGAMESQLRALSPEAVLKRGYSITTLKKSGRLIRKATDVKPGDRLLTRFGEGSVESIAEDQNQPPLFE